MTINYQAELERLKSFQATGSSDFWKAEPGQYKVHALSEITESKPFVDKKTLKETAQAQIRIVVNDEEKIWSFPVGKTLASTYGQLIQLTTSLGTLNGKDFVVVVTSDGKKRNFTVVKL
jgi:hypothetical protein